MANPSANSDLHKILAKDSFMDSVNDQETELAVFQNQAKTGKGIRIKLKQAKEVSNYQY